MKFGGVLHTFSIMPLDTTKPSAKTLRVLDHVGTEPCISLASFLKFHFKYAVFTGRGYVVAPQSVKQMHLGKHGTAQTTYPCARTLALLRHTGIRPCTVLDSLPEAE